MIVSFKYGDPEAGLNRRNRQLHTMVGIPGKSKGCTTCRRRKIRCDQGRPTCQNCFKSKRTCEGYDKYPVFLNRTANGFEKRARLEEVKPSQTEVSANTMIQDQVISWFWDEYAPPLRVHEVKSSYASWLYYTIQMPTPSPALHQALLALSVTTLGRRNADDRLITEGRMLYGQTLTMLQKALIDQWQHDDTLATVRTMVLYENMESTSEDLSAWYTHLSGVAQLLQARGTRRHRSGMSKVVFEDVRFSLMLKAVMMRKASPLGEDRWRNEPWTGKKSSEQLLVDYGFDVASILERAESLKQPAPSKQRLGSALAFLDDCEATFDGLQELYETEFVEPPSQAYETTEWLILKANLWSMQMALMALIKLVSEKIRAVVAAKYLDADQLAQKTKALISLCMDQFKGMHRLNRCLPPIYVLLFHFRHSPAEFEEVRGWRQEIANSMGQRGAKNTNASELVPEVMRNDPGLTEPTATCPC